ncbi:MAG TPA: transporter substrate-binding domain-containing protein [Telmatospirillum sp.]|nr:transporter substrate-binding domain-containing protein [Telmatospirillum sp.]
MTLRIRLIILSILSICLSLTMFSSGGRAETLVLAANDSRPTSYYEGDKLTGVSLEIVVEALRRAGYAVDVRLMPWARCLEDARKGKVDGVFTSFKLPEREEFLTFTNEPLATWDISFFALRDTAIEYDGQLASLSNIAIGMTNKTSYGEAFDNAVKTHIFTNIYISNNPKSLVQMLTHNRVALIVSHDLVAIDTARQLGVLDKIRKLTPTVNMVPTYLAFNKLRDYNNVISAYDAALISMKKDGSYERIYKKYTN